MNRKVRGGGFGLLANFENKRSTAPVRTVAKSGIMKRAIEWLEREALMRFSQQAKRLHGISN